VNRRTTATTHAAAPDVDRAARSSASVGMPCPLHRRCQRVGRPGRLLPEASALCRQTRQS
jgi:hypothetical protein